MGTVVCGIVGDSQAGKTRLAEQLTAALTARGLRVGYLKHAAHGLDPDRPGSDSARGHAAGAHLTRVVAPEQIVQRRGQAPGEPPLDSSHLDVEVAALTGCDLVLVEGYSRAEHPKIRVRRAEHPPREVADPVVLDLVSRGPDWAQPDVDAAMGVVLGLLDGQEPVVTVIADGEVVAMHRFASQVVAGTVLGLTSALKGVDEPRTLTVTVHVPRGAPGG